MRIQGPRYLDAVLPEFHDKDLSSDPDPQDVVASGEIDVFLHGHTHHPKIETLDNGVTVINPGHTKSEWDRGYEPSFAILSIDQDQIDVKIYSLLADKIVQNSKICK